MRKLLIPALFAGCFGTGVQAAEISAAIGATGQGAPALRAGLGFGWDQQWFNTSTGHLTGYWDMGYTYWGAGDQAGTRHTLSFAPVFVYEFGNSGVVPFVEIGVGVSTFSGSRVGDKKLGSAFNFEDRLGAGIKLTNNQRLGVRVIHYSNASIKKPNQGIESYSLFYSHDI
ncbi:acyloxyacyl hydrolase [Pseudomonas sp. COR18]|uniref:acyloxyacyl hydrolase n=1 Tax=Pseudomonas sp. COR18 TaxID=3399680 RepID=UPI003B00B7D8